MNQQRVLVLEDHEAILDVVTEALRYDQLEVLAISDGKQLLSSINGFRPDLILLVYRLADVNGGPICRQLKSMETYRRIPVISFSAYFSPGDTHPAECDGFLYKLFNLAELFKTVGELLTVGREVCDAR